MDLDRVLFPKGLPQDNLQFLRPLLVALIALLAGPEVFLSIDLIALLDILGVALFLAAHSYGVRLAFSRSLEWFVLWAVPIQWKARRTARGQGERATSAWVVWVAVPVACFYLSSGVLVFLVVHDAVHLYSELR